MQSYESYALYKERVKWWHDSKIFPQEFRVSELFLLLNSRLKLFSGKLKSKWNGPYIITRVYGNGEIEIEDAEGVKFKVNSQRLKVYFWGRSWCASC